MGHLRIVYAAGPGNIIGTFRHWLQGRDDPTEVSMTTSGQFYDTCRDFQIESYTISRSHSPGYLREGDFTLVHRPILFETRSAVLYHLGQLCSSFRLLLSALRFRADVVVASSGSAHWFSMAVFPLLGIKIIPELVCVLWPRKKPQGYAARIVRRLDGWFFRWFPFAILSMSHEITAQVEELTGLHHPPIQEFLPTYRREDFANIDRPSYPRLSFRVLYVGRIERNKGVFALLDIARRFRAENRHEIIFDLCGTGSALEELRQLVKAEGLEERFRLHGQCCKPVMRQMFSESHMVVVPTTSDFVEGFNRVVAEGILSGRPVVTSDACPALEYVRDAVIEVPSDDVEAYGNAILLLCDDIELYEAKRIACLAVQSQFYDEERSWGAALKKSILLLGCPTSSTAPAGPSD